MKKRWGYLLAALVVLLGLFVPFLYSQKVIDQPTPTTLVGDNPSSVPSAPPPVVRDLPDDQRVEKPVNTEETSPDLKETIPVKTDTHKPTAPSHEEWDKVQPDGQKIEIAVVGLKGEILFGPTSVTLKEDKHWGSSVLGALEAAGLDYRMSPKYGNLVVSIAGLANQGASGWMYQVNGETPMTAANEKKVNPGDKIIWWYSESLSTPCPAWEELASP